MKRFEVENQSRFPKYLKQEIIKIFVDDPVPPQYLSKLRNSDKIELEFDNSSKKIILFEND